MTTFDDRERMFESKFAHDDAMNFKARARRNRLFGEWVGAELLSLEGDDIAVYAAAVVKSDLEEDGDGDVIRKVHADMVAAGIDLSDHRIEKRLEEFMSEARRQVMDEI